MGNKLGCGKKDGPEKTTITKQSSEHKGFRHGLVSVSNHALIFALLRSLYFLLLRGTWTLAYGRSMRKLKKSLWELE